MRLAIDPNRNLVFGFVLLQIGHGGLSFGSIIHAKVGKAHPVWHAAVQTWAAGWR